MPAMDMDVVERAEHPLDVVERLANVRDWSFDRADENEISVSVTGRGCRHSSRPSNV